MIHQRVNGKLYPVTEAVLHCAAINTGQFDGWTAERVYWEIDAWHKARGFTCFGYHGLIMPDGTYRKGRSFDLRGAHVQHHNTGKLGFLLIERQKITELVRVGERGSLPFTYRKPVFDDWFTQAQAARLRGLLRSVPGLTKVSGHNDYAPRLCPGFKVYTDDWLVAG